MSMSKFIVSLLSLVSGLVYWYYADWWAYVEFPEGPVPKFLMPRWFQAIESSLVGTLVGAVALGLLWVWGRLSRSRPTSDIPPS